MQTFKLAALALVLGAALAGCGGGGEVASPAASSLELPTLVSTAPAVQGHYARLNEIRSAMGLNSLNWSAPLATAAQAHADYQRLNNVQGHGEVQGLPGFTGVGYGDRAARAGYSGLLAGESIIGGNPQSEVEGRDLMDVILAAPGHRTVLLAHEFNEIGVGGAPMTNVLGQRGSQWVDPARVSLYPYNGQNQVLTSFAPASESPNPLPGVALTGMPLSLHGSMFNSFVVTGASLVESASTAAVALLPNADLGQSRSTFVFYPVAALSPNTAYTFSAQINVAGTPRTVTSSFTTGSF